LKLIRASGWELRLGVAIAGIFHPKLVIGGEGFQLNGALRSPSLLYVGSANLTRPGLIRNTECGFLADQQDTPGAGEAFAEMWNAARPANERSLREYSAVFAEANRRRTAKEIEALGVSETEGSSRAKLSSLAHRRPPGRSSVSAEYAKAAWAGLQSFTGGYRFQVEFPRSAGEVVRALIRGRTTSGGYVQVLCVDSGATLPMRFAFYEDNSMFRLNVPNDVSNVAWARSHHDGIAYVSKARTGPAPITLRIIRPSKELDEIVSKSVGLGTWRRTPTRLYGWL